MTNTFCQSCAELRAALAETIAEVEENALPSRRFAIQERLTSWKRLIGATPEGLSPTHPVCEQQTTIDTSVSGSYKCRKCGHVGDCLVGY